MAGRAAAPPPVLRTSLPRLTRIAGACGVALARPARLCAAGRAENQKKKGAAAGLRSVDAVGVFSGGRHADPTASIGQGATAVAAGA